MKLFVLLLIYRIVPFQHSFPTRKFFKGNWKFVWTSGGPQIYDHSSLYLSCMNLVLYNRKLAVLCTIRRLFIHLVIFLKTHFLCHLRHVWRNINFDNIKHLLSRYWQLSWTSKTCLKLSHLNQKNYFAIASLNIVVK